MSEVGSAQLQTTEMVEHMHWWKFLQRASPTARLEPDAFITLKRQLAGKAHYQ